MNHNYPIITVRTATLDDAAELCTILNEIIQIGGTTAIESPLTEDEFIAYFLHGGSHLCCFTAIDESGVLAGFQALERHSELPDDWADIATFARVKPKTAGIGRALFNQSKFYAAGSGFSAINATIRADNHGGLMYYEKMGFETYAVKKNIPLSDGTMVDRISKRLLLNKSTTEEIPG